MMHATAPGYMDILTPIPHDNITGYPIPCHEICDATFVDDLAAHSNVLSGLYKKATPPSKGRHPPFQVDGSRTVGNPTV